MADPLPYADDLLGPEPKAKELPYADDLLGSAPSAPRPEGEQMIQRETFKATPLVGPIMGEIYDHFFADPNSTGGRIMDAFGRGTKEGFGSDSLGIQPGGEADQFLRKAGVWNDYDGHNQTLTKTINEALMRPAATTIDAIWRAGAGLTRGTEAAVAEANIPFLSELGEEAIESGPFTHLPLSIPRMPPDIAAARNVNVIGPGGEAAWKGIEPVPEAPKEIAHQATAEAIRETKPEGPQVLAEAPPQAAPDIHQVARQIDPQTFAQYDALATRQDTYRRWLGDLRETQAERLGPQHEAELAPLLERQQAMQAQIDEPGRTITKAFQQRFDALSDQIDDIRDRHTEELSAETPDMARVRGALQQNDFAMRDLAPQVSAAYRAAQEQMPQAAPEAVQASEAAQAQPAVAEETAPQVPAQAIPAAEIPTEAPKPVPAVADIAADVSQKLQAAGRPADESDAAAALTKAYYDTRAARFGGALGTPEELYAREAPDIQKGGYRAQAAGKTTVGQARKVITLFNKADASTFIHESGHQWLEDLLKDAADERATDTLKADAQTVRNWLGAEDRPTRSQHEKFARGFERYMMEGTAPSRGLAKVFAQFKDWLTKIYETVSRLRSPINDDIRQVFDRMLATAPERTVLAPEREVTPSFASEHERLAEETPEHEATPVADRIRDERNDRDPDTGGVGPASSTRGRGPADREGAGPEPIVAGTGPRAELGTVGEGRGETATEGSRFREEAKREYERIRLPPKPVRLLDFIRQQGGMLDTGGDILKMLGSYKGRPGIINNAKGLAIEDIAQRAMEHGYIRNLDGEPDVRELMDKIEQDIKGKPVYSAQDTEAVAEYERARAARHETEAMAEKYGIDIRGKTRRQVYDELAERMSAEERANEIAQQTAYHEELLAQAENEAERNRGDQAEPTPEPVPRTLEDIDNDRRQEEFAAGLGAKPEQGGGPEFERSGEEPLQEGAGARGGGAGPHGRTGPPSGDELIDKAGNVRLDKVDSEEAFKEALRELAAKNGDFMDARYGTAAYRYQMEIRNTRIMLSQAADDLMEAAQKAADGSPEALADYAAKEQRAAAIFGHLSTLTADWGRTGQEFQKIWPGKEGMKALSEALKQPDSMELFQLRRRAALATKLTKPEQAGKFAADLNRTPWQKANDYLISYFINNLISGPITHMAYSVGNTTFALWKAVPETGIQAALGVARDTERVRFGEVGAQLYGMIRGFRDGLPGGWEAFKSGVQVLPESAIRQKELALTPTARPQVIPGKIGYVLETPSRAVTAIHTVFYSMGYSQEIARLAYRMASDQGLRGDQFDAEVARLTRDPTKEMVERANDQALQQVLMKRPTYGSNFQKLQSFVNSNTAAKIVMPFMQIGTNILTEGMIERTPLSILREDARADLSGKNGAVARDIRASRIIAGSMLGVTTVGLALEGMITGGGPSDPDKQRVKLAGGWKPYSIKVGDLYIPYRKYLGPLGPLVSTAADATEIAEAATREDMAHIASAIGFGFSEVVLDESWMSGLKSFVDAATHWDERGDTYLRNLATSFIPFSVGMAQTARMVDPYQREARTWIDAFRNKTPIVSEEDHPQIDIWGRPIASHTMLSPSFDRNDPVNQRLDALDIGIRPVERKLRGVELTQDQYEAFARMAGTATKQLLDRIVRIPGFANFPAGVQTDMIKSAIRGTREAAEATIIAKSRGTDNDIMRKATDTKVARLSATAP